jgi:hypothetical protein
VANYVQFEVFYGSASPTVTKKVVGVFILRFHCGAVKAEKIKKVVIELVADNCTEVYHETYKEQS